jgi:YD repeat-containing protein
LRRTQNKRKAIWERGYNRSHVLWAGKEKLAKVTLDSSHTLKYVWEAAGRRGEATTLSAAKVAAEYAVLLADRQLSLFDDVSVQSTSAQT